MVSYHLGVPITRIIDVGVYFGSTYLGRCRGTIIYLKGQGGKQESISHAMSPILRMINLLPNLPYLLARYFKDLGLDAQAST